MGICMLTLAIQSDSGLVNDDYYKHGKEINRVLARNKTAHELNLKANLTIEGGTTIRIQLAAADIFDRFEKIELQMVHATKPGLDRRFTFDLIDEVLLVETSPFTSRGRWNLYLQTASWRLTGSIQIPLQKSVKLLPNYFEQ